MPRDSGIRLYDVEFSTLPCSGMPAEDAVGFAIWTGGVNGPASARRPFTEQCTCQPTGGEQPSFQGLFA
jgi:hypothetical protein